jgi:hypothetical protein
LGSAVAVEVFEVELVEVGAGVVDFSGKSPRGRREVDLCKELESQREEEMPTIKTGRPPRCRTKSGVNW